MESIGVVQKYLDSILEEIEYKIYSDFISIDTTIKKARKLFKVDFYEYQSQSTGLIRSRIFGSATLPIELQDHVDFVIGISEFIEDSFSKGNKIVNQFNKISNSIDSIVSSVPWPPSGIYEAGIPITPKVLRDFYNIPKDLIGSNPNNYQSIVAFNDYYSSEALEMFDLVYNISNQLVNVQPIGSLDCISSGCDQFESDLDVQFITALALNITTFFAAHEQGEWLLDWALTIQYQNPLPLVSSVSYGIPELDQCFVFQGDCTFFNYDNTAYVRRSNTAFQKLGLLGMTVVIASGDDGSISYQYVSGNCPLNSTLYCPAGGCLSKTTECPSFTIVSKQNGTTCFFPLGLGAQTCIEMYNDPMMPWAINQFIELNNASSSNCQARIESDWESFNHFHSDCTCTDLTAYEDDQYLITGYTFNPDQGSLFLPFFPGSSPYVTSVGATQILDNQQEILCSVDTGSSITSGGGFSTFQPQPWYQVESVQQYLNENPDALPPLYSFNTSNRVFPDIVMVGHNFQVMWSTTKNGSCPCIDYPLNGTSCSTPTSASFFTLINDKLLNLGLSPLGFVNPLLYQAKNEQPSVFNDITQGNNKCDHFYCCEYGYTTGPGYDLASGLGSLSYQPLEEYIVNLKQSKQKNQNKN
ncbi:peptidase S8 and S53 domain-containing protein [Tieghemostelium lacteum]|uniref:Peptidase S8 and S53 domain-containing protein n=1 Tax=Tieghemostelium lacteum TaxID=361077 RepID=A0A152A0R1_TIELA|nr:peptidase S8 and S53 domain-containing protein [Tieghemostelium lacteum]|eukprot:KYQ99793.1 peptidase S8 and S53 domain-containing protein [Tieghemostelium lacteum]